MMDWWFLCITIATGTMVGVDSFYVLSSTDPTAGLAAVVLTLVVMWSWMHMAQKWQWERQ